VSASTKGNFTYPEFSNNLNGLPSEIAGVPYKDFHISRISCFWSGLSFIITDTFLGNVTILWNLLSVHFISWTPVFWRHVHGRRLPDSTSFSIRFAEQ
jgi:hypothetical protein